jgi:hypothetical protein
MNLARFLIPSRFLFLGLTLLAGCATPDLKPFATETASLGSAISAEQNEVQGHIAKVSARAESRDPRDPRVKDLQSDLDKFARDAAAVDAVMSVAVNYSSALVDLAARGETGHEAADSLGNSLKGISAALGIAFPAAGIPAWAVTLGEETAAAVTRVQAQQSLTEALKVADPVVGRIAKAVASIYATNGAEYKIITGLRRTEQDILTDEVGANRLDFYRKVNVNRVSVTPTVAQTRLEHLFGDVDDRIAKQNPVSGLCGLNRPVAAAGGDLGMMKDDSHCLTGRAVQDLAAVTTLLAGIEPQFRAYTKDVMDAKLWTQQRITAGAQIAEAANAWADEHHSITERINKCGGLRALHQGCGNLTFANLKLFVGRVQTISGKGASNADQ